MKSETLTIRVPKGTKELFYSKTEKYGGHTKVLRELVDAFNQDRLIVKPNRNTGLHKLYEDFNK